MKSITNFQYVLLGILPAAYGMSSNMGQVYKLQINKLQITNYNIQNNYWDLFWNLKFGIYL
ncbi:MAG: hypothetical protein GY795_42640 [Desulfobacterales bacterium]|nr:hypothetical protein [Desulfobacterales bacterium]